MASRDREVWSRPGRMAEGRRADHGVAQIVWVTIRTSGTNSAAAISVNLIRGRTPGSRFCQRRGAVTLVYSSHDTEHNNAVALREYLRAKARRPRRFIKLLLRRTPH